MSDIFISYASADRPHAEQLAKALENEGWTVWWDRSIPPGKSFDKVIEEALDGAKCTIVMWSQGAIASQWVRAEASEALRKNNLIPVRIADVQPPLAFRQIQAADLRDWDGTADHFGFHQLIGALTGAIGTSSGASIFEDESSDERGTEPKKTTTHDKPDTDLNKNRTIRQIIRVFLIWIFAQIIAISLGLLSFYLLISILNIDNIINISGSTETVRSVFIVYLCTGLLTTITQGFVLRKYHVRFKTWIYSGIFSWPPVGLVTIFVLASGVNTSDSVNVAIYLVFPVISVFVASFIQARALPSSKILWIFSNTISFNLFNTLVVTNNPSHAIIDLEQFITQVAIWTVVTAVTITWIFSRPTNALGRPG